MPALILLVEANQVARQRIEALLSDIGYLVAWVSSFNEAKELLDSVLPDLLIAAARLEVFNGLHLAARSRHDYPNLPVIITHTAADAILEAEATRHGAHFVAKPLENPEFLRLIESALEEHRHLQPRIRRWPRKRVAGVVEAQLPTARARVHDMSYEGLRLAFGDQQELPAEFDVTLPTGLTIKARRVWTSRSEATDEFWCGVRVAVSESPASGDWRTFVDSL